MYDAKDLLTEITIRNKHSTDEIVEEILNAVIRDMLNRRSLIGTIKYSVVCDFISARIPKTVEFDKNLVLVEIINQANLRGFDCEFDNHKELFNFGVSVESIKEFTKNQKNN
ncbi:hypothetical protein [Aeromonas phage AS-yj]|uniref:Uncharacterized protein n=5 Tax=Caudoviricetes TaxID=2731619 RepID=A0A411B8K3_9CAUD|nr:hypothetical protein HWB28_gp072 [Aeromonas phage AS-zj]YP_009835003.1 hypothetical protein HWB29_gp301 [Aeromonas phage AS-sw]ATI17994.1 hypothetical protein [Aeromonas phage AS-yj]QAX97956.1 hypothetical protein ASswx1_314 [Aeromonas phage Asswx_1]QAX98997.1 hypothetical protein assk_206 [Aeromonas phage Assk]ASU00480.1 hypothetical protein [Aeromonas phage AS-zj]ATI18351.1 hypothetical protein [Aeromonas phage AS-sw]